MHLTVTLKKVKKLNKSQVEKTGASTLKVVEAGDIITDRNLMLYNSSNDSQMALGS